MIVLIKVPLFGGTFSLILLFLPALVRVLTNQSSLVLIPYEPDTAVIKNTDFYLMKTMIRKSHTGEQQIYFWTATIHKWYNLLSTDEFKQVIIGSLKNLSDRQLITVYAFVIMPTHIHLIWRLNEANGKESAKGSFMKFTAHEFKKKLQPSGGLEEYRVNAANKVYQFWQRDSLGIAIWSREVASQKLDYIHGNPVAGKWLLAKDDISYHFSSARFYEFGKDDFGFLKNLFLGI